MKKKRKKKKNLSLDMINDEITCLLFKLINEDKHHDK